LAGKRCHVNELKAHVGLTENLADMGPTRIIVRGVTRRSKKRGGKNTEKPMAVMEDSPKAKTGKTLGFLGVVEQIGEREQRKENKEKGLQEKRDKKKK